MSWDILPEPIFNVFPVNRVERERNLDVLRDLVVGVGFYGSHDGRFLYDESLVENQDSLKFSDDIVLGFRDAPAAYAHHHNFLGGLVVHILGMWSVYARLCNSVSEGGRESILGGLLNVWCLDPVEVLMGCVLHDFHKGFDKYHIPKSFDLELGVGFEDVLDKGKFKVSHTDSYMSSDVKSVWMCSKFGIKLDPQVLNMIFNSEGGYSQNAQPVQTPLSKLVYILDELDANVLERLRQGERKVSDGDFDVYVGRGGTEVFFSS